MRLFGVGCKRKIAKQILCDKLARPFNIASTWLIGNMGYDEICGGRVVSSGSRMIAWFGLERSISGKHWGFDNVAKHRQGQVRRCKNVTNNVKRRLCWPLGTIFSF